MTMLIAGLAVRDHSIDLRPRKPDETPTSGASREPNAMLPARRPWVRLCQSGSITAFKVSGSSGTVALPVSAVAGLPVGRDAYDRYWEMHDEQRLRQDPLVPAPGHVARQSAVQRCREAKGRQIAMEPSCWRAISAHWGRLTCLKLKSALGG